jgi:transcription elongation factor GreA
MDLFLHIFSKLFRDFLEFFDTNLVLYQIISIIDSMAPSYINKITPQGFKLLHQQIKDFKGEIKRLSLELANAKAQGDLSENQAVTDISRTLRNAKTKLSHLEEVLSHVTITTIKSSDTVEFGATVELKNFKTNRLDKFTIVGGFESSTEVNKISADSQLAQMLRGKRVGDVIFIGSKNIKLEIISITY